MSENWDIDIVIDSTGYHSKKQQEKTILQIYFVLFTRPASPSGIYGYLFFTTYAVNNNSEKENTMWRYSHLFA